MLKTIIVLSLCLSHVLGGQCPSADRITPCTCTNTTIKCTSAQDFDLAELLQEIANGKEPFSKELSFETFVLNSSKVTSLKSDLFQGIIFDTIRLVDCTQLTCVDPSAFAGLERNLTKFIADKTSFKSNDTNCNVFDAIKRLYNLEEVVITRSDITEIPANAFGSLKRLETIDLSGGLGGNITTVGRDAFSGLQVIEKIDLSNHNITKIESFGFAFLQPSDEHLVIDLTHNKLTEDSFGSDALEVNGRITELVLNANLGLKVLAQTVFEPFLLDRANRTHNNQIQLTGTPIQCTAKNVWLFENDAALGLKAKLKDVLAEDGQSFWKHTRSECAKH